jgi:HEAT repeat protein
VLGLLLSTAPANAFVWPSTIERITRALDSDDLMTRRGAAAELRALPASDQRRLIPHALDDSDVEVRAEAANAAIRLRLPIAERVIPWLTDADASLRRIAAEALEASPEDKAIPLLGRVLADPEPVVRVAAVRALAASHDPDAALALLGRVDDVDPRVRESALEALAQRRDRRTTLALVAKVRDPRSSVRKGAIEVLGKLGDVRASSSLIAALSDSEAEVQIAALTALANLRAADAVPSIAPLARQTTRKEVADAALIALGRIQSPDAVATLIDAAASDGDAQGAAMRGAFSSAGAAALRLLSKCLDGQPTLARANGCVRALGYVSGAKAAEAVLDALRRRVSSPAVALLALARLGTDTGLETILEYLASSEQATRQSAILAAARMLDPESPDGRAIEPIVKALEAARELREERIDLIRLLGLTGSVRAVPWLVRYAAVEGDIEARVTALDALGNIRGGDQTSLLIAALDDRSKRIRVAAASSLRRLADPTAVQPLLLRIEGQGGGDRELFALALGGSLARASDDRTLSSVAKLIRDSRGMARDTWIEAASFIPGRKGAGLLLEVGRGGIDADDQAKVAEVLSAHPEARSSLLDFTKTTNERARANAVWSLTRGATKQDAPDLRALSMDEDPAVAANAMAALARLAAREPALVADLCTGLHSDNVYVRVNALVGLRLAKARCADAEERKLLLTDPRPEVRRAAAWLLSAIPSSASSYDVDALARCSDRDSHGGVALACAKPPFDSEQSSSSVTVFITANKNTKPAAYAVFALMHGDGLVRVGRADRRGAVFEPNALGVLRLEEPISASGL